MTRPDDIPADALEAAKRAAYAVEGTFDDGAITSFNGVRVIARAILTARSEQREEDARIAEGFERNRDWAPSSLYDTLRREVAAAIRNGGK